MSCRTIIAMAAWLAAAACLSGGPLAAPDGAVLERYRHIARIPRAVGMATWRSDAESVGATAQDERVHQWMTRWPGRTAAGYADLCYGAEGWRQLTRAVLERAAQYADPPHATARMAMWCPLNLPCHVPGTPRTWYARGVMRTAPVAGNRDLVAVAGRMVDPSATNGYSDVRLWSGMLAMGMDVPPASAVACRTMDLQSVSYTLPCVGVVVHRNTDYAHEMAHYMNFPPPDAPFAWKEFLPAFHALKVHAHSLGIDLGTEGGWAQYQARYPTEPEVAALAETAEVSADGIALLVQYIRSAADSDIRRWCESASIGRAVL